jgi:pimeloyl-ACP methyl ester carboxylesterase/predicted glycosyltransferase
MRARDPDVQGYVDHDGIKIGYEVFGEGEPAFLLLPTWTLVHSRFWKLQVPYLAQRHRVITFDGPGNGRSDRSTEPAHYRPEGVSAMALKVLDATGTEQAILGSLSKGAGWSLCLAAEHPERVLGQAFIGPTLPLTPPNPDRADIARTFFDEIDDPQGWQKYNAHHWTHHYEDFVEFFFDECLVEPHSTKQVEDSRGWAADTTPEMLLADDAAWFPERDDILRWCAAVDHPVLVIHGDHDRITPLARGEALADATGGELAVLEGAGHFPMARDPVRVNRLVADFGRRIAGWRRRSLTWTRGRARSKRALYVSSPIGLGHARRDIAIVQALRQHHPELQVDWLAQHPITQVLEAEGETVHPASRLLASESAHMTAESGEHDLHCFQAWRRMDEILLADFMVFHDVVTSQHYDLVVGDEAWEVDYYLHENPELKTFAYAWSTDFVGWLPMPDGGDREAYLTADYNAEMIEHIARYPRVRDVAHYIGSPGDIVDERFGPDLPMIREWTEEHYRFPGYVTGFDPASLGDRAELRADLGFRDDEQVCVVAVGGSGVGTDLLRRVSEAFPAARRQVPDLRMIVVAGPRIDPETIPAHEGLEVRGYVHRLHRHLAAADLAIVQGGLTTCMELTASRTPFVYLPLRHHFEQNFHVHHRLCNHRAGRRLDFDEATPDHLAAVIAAEIGRDVDYRPVETDGAARVAADLAQLL